MYLLFQLNFNNELQIWNWCFVIENFFYDCRIFFIKYIKNINIDFFRFRFLFIDFEDFLVDFIDDFKEYKVRFVYIVFFNSFVCQFINLKILYVKKI